MELKKILVVWDAHWISLPPENMRPLRFCQFWTQEQKLEIYWPPFYRPHPKDGGRYCFQFVSSRLDGRGGGTPSQVLTGRGSTPSKVRTEGGWTFSFVIILKALTVGIDFVDHVSKLCVGWILTQRSHYCTQFTRCNNSIPVFVK